MERFTIAAKSGCYAVSNDLIVFGDSVCTGEAIDRLAAYENMHEAIEQHYEQAAEKLEALKAQGKLKSTTAKTLLAQKITYSSMMNLIDLHR